MHDLNKFLESISPEKNIYKINREVDNAFIGFHISKTRASSFKEFTNIMAELYCHLQNKFLRLNPPKEVDYDFDWDFCIRLLEKEYGKNGFRTAFDFARKGELYTVLKSTAKQFAIRHHSKLISITISAFLSDLSVDEQIWAAQMYVKKYGYLLPSEFTECGAIRVLANFPKVLEQHPKTIEIIQNKIRNNLT